MSTTEDARKRGADRAEQLRQNSTGMTDEQSTVYALTARQTAEARLSVDRHATPADLVRAAEAEAAIAAALTDEDRRAAAGIVTPATLHVYAGLAATLATMFLERKERADALISSLLAENRELRAQLRREPDAAKSGPIPAKSSRPKGDA